MNFCYECILLYFYQCIAVGQYLVGKNMYHSHHDMTKELRMLAKVYPNRTHLYSIGSSAEGRELWVLSLSSHDPHKHLSNRPEISLVGNMHGDETVGKEMLLYLAVYLVEFYDYDATIREIMDKSRIHILPSMNPDGFASSTEGTCDGAVGRGNARKVDLNRNFPDFWETNDVEREPETKAVIAWLDAVPFALAANFHGGTLVANYPFDNNKEGSLRYSEAPDDDILKHLALTYSKAHRKMYEGHSGVCGDSSETFIDGITNGADWYPVRGSLQDYQYGFKGIMATTMEISCCKYPKAETLVEFWQENREPLLEYLKQANRGVRGFVKDSETGAGIRSMVHIHGRRIKFFTSHHGEYYRILLPGVYIIRVQSASDFYEPKSVTFTVPKDLLLVELNITLDFSIRIPSKSRTSKLPMIFSNKPNKTLVNTHLVASSDYIRTTSLPKNFVQYSTQITTTEQTTFSTRLQMVPTEMTTEKMIIRSSTEQIITSTDQTMISSESSMETSLESKITSVDKNEDNNEITDINFNVDLSTTTKPRNVHNMTVFEAFSRVKDESLVVKLSSGGCIIRTSKTFTLFISVLYMFSNRFFSCNLNNNLL